MRAGTRVKAIRELTGFTRSDFAADLGMDFMRLRNVEQLKAKVSEDEFCAIGKAIPELIHYLVYGGIVHKAQLKDSDNAFARLIYARLEAGQMPDGFDLEKFII